MNIRSIIALTLIVILCGAVGFFLWSIFPPAHTTAFADIFNAITTLFTGLAFAGIIFTVVQQQKELRLQRKELKLTRKELKATRREFKEQNKTLKKQRFENTFFNLLNHYLTIVKEIYLDDRPVKPIGHEAFRTFTTLLHEKAKLQLAAFKRDNGLDQSVTINELSSQQIDQILVKITDEIFIRIHSNLYLYVQNLTLVFRMIHESNLLESQDERQFYGQIINDQMSPYQKFVVLYYCLLPQTDAKILGNYLQFFHTLDSLKPEDLISASDKQSFDKWGHQHKATPS